LRAEGILQFRHEACEQPFQHAAYDFRIAVIGGFHCCGNAFDGLRQTGRNRLADMTCQGAVTLHLRRNLSLDEIGHELGQIFDQRLLELRRMRFGFLG
jgi:hypothetical protein